MKMSHARKEYTDFQRLAPDAFDLVQGLGRLAAKAGIDKQLLELVKLRASQGSAPPIAGRRRSGRRRVSCRRLPRSPCGG
jgi:hypothetical protein